MGKKLLLLIIFTIFIFSSCSQLNRNNPTDPKSNNYIGFTYKGQSAYPSDAVVSALDINSGTIMLGAVSTLNNYGECIVEISPNQQTGYVTLSGTSMPTDLCHDSAGDEFITDAKNIIQIMGSDGYWHYITITATTITTLYLVSYNSNIYLSNTSDQTLQIYTKGANLDSWTNSTSVSVTSTSNGQFSPGRIFASADYIYVVNNLNKMEVLQFNPGNLSAQTATDIIFGADVVDAALYQNNTLQVLSEQAIYQVNENFSIIKTWGNYGQGDGRVSNGRLIAYDGSSIIYILDGVELKMFGTN